MQTQIDRILVGVDFSAPSVAAARWAARHLARRGRASAEVVLVHVVFIPEPPRLLRGRFPDPRALESAARVGAQAQLEELRPSLGPIPVRLEVRVGRPAEQIALAARECSADLVVVGKHGERPGVWNMLGSTAEHVLRTVETPVLVVTDAPSGTPSHILAAADDSDVTPAVLAWASLLAGRWEAEVTALHVVSAAVMSHVLSMAAIGAEDDVVPTPELVREEFRVERDRWVKLLGEAGVPRARASSEVAFGDAGQEIVAAALRLDCDLLVLGDRGAGAVPRALLGSTLREVLRSSPRPVLVVGA